jgi:hypothetical protein
MYNTNNGSPGQGWGGSCDEIIFEDGTLVVVTPDFEGRAPAYGAGFGNTNFSWSCGWYYRQVELAQGNIDDDFTDAQIDTAAQREAEFSVRYGYPIHRIPWIHQQMPGSPEPGQGTHQESDNGKRLGKTDTGYKFPWTRFLALAQHYVDVIHGEDDMAFTRDDFKEIMREAVDEKLGLKWRGQADLLSALDTYDGLVDYEQFGTAVAGKLDYEKLARALLKVANE